MMVYFSAKHIYIYLWQSEVHYHFEQSIFKFITVNVVIYFVPWNGQYVTFTTMTFKPPYESSLFNVRKICDFFYQFE